MSHTPERTFPSEISSAALERSEKMKLWAQEPQPAKGAGPSEKAIVDRSGPIPAAPQAPGLREPGAGSLHEPAQHAQAGAVLGVALGQDRADPPAAQPLPHRFGVGAPLPLRPRGLLPFGPRLAAGRRHRWEDL